MPKFNPYAQRKVDEKTKSDGEIDSKEHELQHLKDRLRIQQDTITSLRNQIKNLKAKKKE